MMTNYDVKSDICALYHVILANTGYICGASVYDTDQIIEFKSFSIEVIVACSSFS